MQDKPSKQLRIGVPNQESHQRTFLESFALTALICLVAFWVLVPTVFLGERVPPSLTPQQQASQRHDAIAELARTMQAITLEEARTSVPGWSHDRLLAALRYGPRPLSEVVCEHILDSRDASFTTRTPSQHEELQREMATSLRERAEHAPRICLVAHLLHDRLPPNTSAALLTELASYWEALRACETIESQDAFLVNGLRLSERLPLQRPDFLLWLRQCATLYDRASWRSCVRAMHDLAPAQGSDLLEMVELDLLDREDPNRPPSTAHMKRLISTLRALALQGSPEEWRVDDHPQLLRYDYDLRLASLFTLCRWAHSPRKEDALLAAEAIRDVGRFDATGTDDNLFRIRDTCRILFGGNYHDLEIASYPLLVENRVPALTVVEESLEEPPHYSFASLIERGDCELDDARPLWYCGAKLWKGRHTDIAESVSDAYINTRYVNWAAREDIPPLDFMLLRKDVLPPPPGSEPLATP